MGPHCPGAQEGGRGGCAAVGAPGGRCLMSGGRTARVPSRPPPSNRSGYLTRAIISRDDKRYEDTVELSDGIRVRLRDTDPDPLDADLEIRRGKRRIAKLKDVRRGPTIPVIGRSGRP